MSAGLWLGPQQPPPPPCLARTPLGCPDGRLAPRWFCHVDDDNYVNVRALLRLLSSYSHTQDVYIGKPSLDRPIQATERVSENKMVSRLSEGAGASREEAEDLPSLGCGGLTTSAHIAASRPLLVRHGRGRLLHQPRAGAEDEPVGQVSAGSSGEAAGRARWPWAMRPPRVGSGLAPSRGRAPRPHVQAER